MAFSKQFEKELDKLFKQRTHWLRSVLGLAKHGKPSRFDRKKVDKGIALLQDIASKDFARTRAKEEFDEHVTVQKSWRVKGRGPEDKKKRFNKWYRILNLKKGCVYAFWGKHKRCLWVGRTGTRGTRPSDHFNTRWFPQASRIAIYHVKGTSHIPKIECLARHRFQPLHNKNTPATKKWTKKCPLCAIHKDIEQELRRIFRLR